MLPVQAVRRFRDSVTLWKDVAWSLELARTCLKLSAAEATSGEAVNASGTLEQAITLFRTSGAKLEHERAIALRLKSG